MGIVVIGIATGVCEVVGAGVARDGPWVHPALIASITIHVNIRNIQVFIWGSVGRENILFFTNLLCFSAVCSPVQNGDKMHNFWKKNVPNRNERVEIVLFE